MAGLFSNRLNDALRWMTGHRTGVRRRSFGDQKYHAKLAQEIRFFESCENVHDLPAIFHYWSNKYLVPKLEPFGFHNAQEFCSLYIQRVCESFPAETCRLVSLGSGNCDLEIEVVEKVESAGIANFTLECLDINQDMLERGRVLATRKGFAHRMHFRCVDLNAWRPDHGYHVILAIQCLHHFEGLEPLFDNVKQHLHPHGFFLVDDMIGRNGHMRWPEALAIVNEFWAELPEKYKYNHQLKRLEREYENWDCSVAGFEGIRSQDILPLLIGNFHFEFFIAFGNVIDLFVDRCFGPNYDPTDVHDRELIDRIHTVDEVAIENGKVKPTHMLAALCTPRVGRTRTYKHLTPAFCLRDPKPEHNSAKP